MCDCVDVKTGTYLNQTILDAPYWSIKDKICIDSCLKDEILFLWDKDIITLGCCCGHNETNAYIQVDTSSILRMKSLGYKAIFNEFTGIGDCFYPKIIGNYYESIESI